MDIASTVSRMDRKTLAYIAFYTSLYLLAVVLANLSAAHFGPAVTIINAFLFIGLDLTARDKLHDAWRNNNLVSKMVLLILSGSALSWILNKSAGQIALASFVSFAVSAGIDTAVYHLLRNYTHLIKINGSNLFSGAADSIIFPTLAFGSFLPLITLGQFVAKFGGGFVWSLILNHKSVRRAVFQGASHGD